MAIDELAQAVARCPGSGGREFGIDVRGKGDDALLGERAHEVVKALVVELFAFARAGPGGGAALGSGRAGGVMPVGDDHQGVDAGAGGQADEPFQTHRHLPALVAGPGEQRLPEMVIA